MLLIWQHILPLATHTAVGLCVNSDSSWDTPRGLNNVNRAFHFIDRPRKRTKTSETGYRQARRSESVLTRPRSVGVLNWGVDYCRWSLRIDNVCFSKLTKRVAAAAAATYGSHSRRGLKMSPGSVSRTSTGKSACRQQCNGSCWRV